MDIGEIKEKKEIIKWLNTALDNNSIIFDYVLDIRDEILAELNNNNLNLRYGQETFLINLIYFLYNNSHTKVI